MVLVDHNLLLDKLWYIMQQHVNMDIQPYTEIGGQNMPPNTEQLMVYTSNLQPTSIPEISGWPLWERKCWIKIVLGVVCNIPYTSTQYLCIIFSPYKYLEIFLDALNTFLLYFKIKLSSIFIHGRQSSYWNQVGISA